MLFNKQILERVSDQLHRTASSILHCNVIVGLRRAFPCGVGGRGGLPVLPCHGAAAHLAN